ncbi:putative alpha-ketoglutarate-dependent sulfonate dioxygenase [Bisporella sp. PMI_857]|nr:putative alpha-ketoglutarate-dependent sulfonate dioxygenase [Bisporella sp. PMI_857]KAH8600314.1 putative alpha-ketoglutarate-dependent sulfonate dioxygenase [Bisporella sp. PMI_857]
MAPSRTDNDFSEPRTTYDVNVPYKTLSDDYLRQTKERTEFPEYLPVWEEGVWHDDFPIFDYEDPALRADKTKPHLFTEGVSAQLITPRMGTILTGVKLETLSKEGKDELALLICERKVVVLREQLNFLKAGPQFQVDFMEYYGKLSMQPVTGHIKGFPQYHMTTTIWHHDVSYERQPPGYIMLGILACPNVGGDTIVCDTTVAYKRLSPLFQRMLNEVKVVHTSEKMLAHARASKGMIRSNPINSVHPLIRVHPVTGERAIFLNREFPKEILGLKDLEAECITKFLMDTMAMGHDYQARIHWEKHSVVMFDGRSTIHTGTVDYDTSLQARHLFRLAAMTEVPISVEESERKVKIDGH